MNSIDWKKNKQIDWKRWSKTKFNKKYVANRFVIHADEWHEREKAMISENKNLYKKNCTIDKRCCRLFR